ASSEVQKQAEHKGYWQSLLNAGAKPLPPGCGPCIGLGAGLLEDGEVGISATNRNFKGRSGTVDAEIYLTSPEVAVACTLNGCFTDPRTLGEYPHIRPPERFAIDDSMIIPPSTEGATTQIRRGPNIRPLPKRGLMEDCFDLEVLLKLEANITTDDIMPAGSKILPLRSNIEAISAYVFSGIDPDFPGRAKAAGAGCILAGENYGQGSSREHAALAPLYLGVKAVFALSFARIHRSNLINFGIIPITISVESYEVLKPGERLSVKNIHAALTENAPIEVFSLETGKPLDCAAHLSQRESEILSTGGLLNYIKSIV
ncbi:MAG: aconitase family protein, partial [Desulfomonilia bacterium]|nr:aconitase family protein [Desulfomonilia bacterium]